MARENVSFTRYYYKVIIWGGGGVGNRRVHRKARAYNSGSVGQDALPGTLHLLVQIVAIPPKNPKITPEKKKPNFYPPPTHTHTHTCAGAIHKGSVFEKCFLSEETSPITLKHKICPLIPHKLYQTPYVLPPPPPPPPLCLLYHNIDSSDQWRIQGDSGGSL